MIKNYIYVFLVLFFSSLLYGNIYFWTDGNGTRHFTNITPPLNEKVEELKETNLVFQKLTSKENKNYLFRVLKVFDGDTIKVEGLDLIFKIRLVGIDSPEIGYNGQKSQPFSHRAKQYLSSLLENKKVAIKSYGTGAYNRQLAEVFAGSKNINMEMVKAGLAEAYTGRQPENFDSHGYFKEELRAKRAGIGMWIQKSAYKTPKQWRKEHPRK
ncbi:MAG: DUF4124 domain-containing protein [Deltaproteobacteria bacterium]|nr:DUF4124 domain-containing protein [Deltaproteobacteria bacterium]